MPNSHHSRKRGEGVCRPRRGGEAAFNISLRVSRQPLCPHQGDVPPHHGFSGASAPLSQPRTSEEVFVKPPPRKQKGTTFTVSALPDMDESLYLGLSAFPKPTLFSGAL